MMQKPFSQACENNKTAILDVITQYFHACSHILEIGSGTGQHAVFFSSVMPWLRWQTSDLKGNHPGIISWLSGAGLENIQLPVELDVSLAGWPVEGFDGVFSANTSHIMAWPEVKAMFQGIGRHLPSGGFFCLYGPFNYQGQYTSESNALFDRHLKQRAPHMGIRNFETINSLASEHGLVLIADHEMPANNRTLVWKKAWQKVGQKE
ncbi:DUF938 domain-containing protein [Endozoicomonas sp.]|uniref:DUF938 domain-containing protein n=1 Tax=Endozoicomonas sp. TaxID=1892382 RepID=UPI002885F780|nr:DUF938 domain-containing protein [Endozoicomonas sp.]